MSESANEVKFFFNVLRALVVGQFAQQLIVPFFGGDKLQESLMD
jgi:hypothetical protein